MSNNEYRSGYATKIDVPAFLNPDETKEFLLEQVKTIPDHLEYLVDEDYWDVHWYDKETKTEVVHTQYGWYLIEYIDRDEGYIHFAHKDGEKILFAFVYYNGGTFFNEELEQAIEETA